MLPMSTIPPPESLRSMSERDLIYFEQMLPKLQRYNQQKQGVTAFQSQKVKSKELER